MNILIDELPTCVNIDGEKYQINADFRTSILFTMLMKDDRLSESMKIEQALDLYYPIKPKQSQIMSSINKIMWFYSCGESEKGVENHKKSKKNKTILDYEEDAPYIYSAFMSQYRIDLQDIRFLHWWKFKSLLDSISEDTRLFKIMQYRAVDINKIKDKEQKKFYQNMQKMYNLDKPSQEDMKLIEKINNKLK